IILNSSNPKEIDENQISTLFVLSDNFDIYIVIQVKDENEQNEIFNSIILFCSTAPGKGHIARHIESYIFVDDDVENINNFSKFIPKIICISDTNSNSLINKNNVEIVQSLEKSSIMNVKIN
ncbi:hypothetical protein U3516DRAFT_673113, partial [Neocallimastix sp. 'constans']